LDDRVNKLTTPQREVFEQISKTILDEIVLNAVAGPGKGLLAEYPGKYASHTPRGTPDQ